jgi:hypothetical protein
MNSSLYAHFSGRQNEKLIESVSTATLIKHYGFNKSLCRVWSATDLI